MDKEQSKPKVLVTRPALGKNPPPWGYLIAGIILTTTSIFLLVKTYQVPKVSFSDSVVKVELAQTDQEQKQGLSGRENLGEDNGMLFVYQTDTQPKFFMKDMKFPLDFIWIKSDDTVAWITPNVSPDTYPENFQPPEPIKYVLEVNAGYAEEHNIRKGDNARVQL